MALKRELNPNWHGGRSISSHGYVLVKVDESKYSIIANGYAYEHKYIMEKTLGRKLIKGEIVHHANHNRQDNRIENLMLCDFSNHKFMHRKNYSHRQTPGEKNICIVCACGCGQSLKKYDRSGRPRKSIFGHNIFKGTGKKTIIEMIDCACGCGNKINKYDKYGRLRRFISGHNGRVL
jgi:hypothetical protein